MTRDSLYIFLKNKKLLKKLKFPRIDTWDVRTQC